MFISITTKLYGSNGELYSSLMLINSSHIVSVTAEKEGSLIILADGTTYLSEESICDLFKKLKFSEVSSKHDDWRSVDDKLPETNHEVLADVAFDTGYGLCHDYCIAHFDQIGGQWYTREKQPIKVVNWMPLPQLPKDNDSKI